MTEYEKLVRDGAAIVRLINFNKPHWDEECARAILALIAERLKEHGWPTLIDEMDRDGWETDQQEESLERCFDVVLAILVPPKGKANG